MSELGVDPRQTELVKAVRSQLENLFSYGLAEPTARLALGGNVEAWGSERSDGGFRELTPQVLAQDAEKTGDFARGLNLGSGQRSSTV